MPAKSAPTVKDTRENVNTLFATTLRAIKDAAETDPKRFFFPNGINYIEIECKVGIVDVHLVVSGSKSTLLSGGQEVTG